MWVLASGLPGKSFSCLSYLWPFPLQVIVQNYNSVLTLSHLYRSSDALLVHENDAVHKICAKLMNIKQISFCDINQASLGSFMPTVWGPYSLAKYAQSPTLWPPAFKISIWPFIYWLLLLYVGGCIRHWDPKINEIHSFPSRRILSIRETDAYKRPVHFMWSTATHYSETARKIGTWPR